MRRIIPCMTLALLAMVAASALAVTPNPNGAAIHERVFNDCPSSVLTTTNNYPTSISIDDAKLDCIPGWANLHIWRFSEDGGVTEAVFNNDSNYHFSADLTITGTANGEAGLNISPWWSRDVDGRFMVNASSGEVAIFGGRLPFYSFTANWGVHYLKGSTIHLEMTYQPNGLSLADPATVTYLCSYQGNTYARKLPFDQGNPAEDPPYGQWGMLNNGRAGGYIQAQISGGNPDTNLRADWTNIRYWNLDEPVATQPTTWGTIKAIYR